MVLVASPRVRYETLARARSKGEKKGGIWRGGRHRMNRKGLTSVPWNVHGSRCEHLFSQSRGAHERPKAQRFPKTTPCSLLHLTQLLLTLFNT
ncbi:unnamed protein product [Nesidiocoris tenuis]|uniref:Uncharacterized protein n=1 Tax=Nesidiocoris tenuis TaxID=355587 RepID=A0A6H5H125_9HEMI|nr:unnamed protein product [Nesidiocoris tenuis]